MSQTISSESQFTEEYRVIVDFPMYEVSALGHIRNVKTKVTKYTHIDHYGYESTTIKLNGKKYTRKVHRLVAEAWLEPPSAELIEYCSKEYPFKVLVNHIDHNRSNNVASNLEWVSQKGNIQACIKAGKFKSNVGEHNPRSELTEELVHELCRNFESGMMPKEAVEKFGISKQQATKIRAGFQWKYIWEQYNIKVNRRRSTTSRKAYTVSD